MYDVQELSNLAGDIRPRIAQRSFLISFCCNNPCLFAKKPPSWDGILYRLYKTIKKNKTVKIYYLASLKTQKGPFVKKLQCQTFYSKNIKKVVKQASNPSTCVCNSFIPFEYRV